MKILITGAHFTPAQAVIEEIQKEHPQTEIVYIGRKTTIEGDKTPSVESQILPKLGVKFIPIIAGRIRRVVEWKTVVSFLKIPIGFIQSFYYVAKERPTIVVSFGGYVAVPVVFAAWLLRIPVLVHEQTLVSGMANTVSARFANKIAVTFNTDYAFPRKKLIVTGNPMRREVLVWEEKEKNESDESIENEFKTAVKLAYKEKLPIILITGGNQGSHTLNTAVEEILSQLTEIAVVIHQTGDSSYKDFERLDENKSKLTYKNHYYVAKWIHAAEFGYVLRNTDLVISRAGINTLLELAMFEIPTLVIPLPFVNRNEQMVNAKFFQELGLCEILEQKDLNGHNLLREINVMLHDLPVRKQQAEKANDVVITDAASRLTKEIFHLIS